MRGRAEVPRTPLGRSSSQNLRVGCCARWEARRQWLHDGRPGAEEGLRVARRPRALLGMVNSVARVWPQPRMHSALTPHAHPSDRRGAPERRAWRSLPWRLNRSFAIPPACVGGWRRGGDLRGELRVWSTDEDLKGHHGEDGQGDDYRHEVARRLLEGVGHELREDHPDHGPRGEPEPVR